LAFKGKESLSQEQRLREIIADVNARRSIPLDDTKSMAQAIYNNQEVDRL